MAKKHEAEHQSAEAGGLRWLLTYADLVTLLLACFVVLFATREPPSPETLEIIAKAAGETFGVPHGTPFQTGENPIEGGSGIFDSQGIHVADVAGKKKREFQQNLPTSPVPPKPPPATDPKEAVLPCPDGAKCEKLEEGMVVEFKGDFLFDSGSSLLRPEARQSLNKVGRSLKVNTELRFEGHTDSDPIRSAAFPSNWELSTGRAASVAKYFIDTFDFPPNRVSIAGYAEFRPEGDCVWSKTPKECNKDLTQKRRNRRVVITIINEKRNKLPGTGTTTEAPSDEKPLPRNPESMEEDEMPVEESSEEAPNEENFDLPGR